MTRGFEAYLANIADMAAPQNKILQVRAGAEQQHAADLLDCLHLMALQDGPLQLTDFGSTDVPANIRIYGRFEKNPNLSALLQDPNNHEKLRHLYVAREALQADPDAYLRANHPTRFDRVAEADNSTAMFLDLKRDVQDGINAAILTAIKREELILATINDQLGPILQHHELQVIVSRLDEHGRPNTRKIAAHIYRHVITELKRHAKYLARRLPMHRFPAHSTITTLRQFALHLQRVLNSVGYILEESVAEDGTIIAIHDDARTTVDGIEFAEFVFRCTPTGLHADINAFMDERDNNYRFEIDGAPPFATQAAMINSFDHYQARAQPVYANLAHTGPTAGLPQGPAGTGAGGGGGRGGGRGGGGGGGRGGGNGGVGVNGAWNALPSRSTMVPSDTTVLPPCSMCQYPTPGPAHTPATCTSNPANMTNGVRPAVVRICMTCGNAPWHRPCPATAAQLAVFALTPLGQRCAVWRNSQVRRPRTLRRAPALHGRPHVARPAIDKINEYLADQPSPPSPAAVPLPASAIVLLDGGATNTLVGEHIPLADIRPATGVVQGIGADCLNIVGKGILRLGTLRIPALRVDGLKTSLISETELLNSDPNIAITVPAAPCGQHVKQVTYNDQVLMSVPESAGLFVLPSTPPTVATSCRQSGNVHMATCTGHAAITLPRATEQLAHAATDTHDELGQPDAPVLDSCAAAYHILGDLGPLGHHRPTAMQHVSVPYSGAGTHPRHMHSQPGQHDQRSPASRRAHMHDMRQRALAPPMPSDSGATGCLRSHPPGTEVCGLAHLPGATPAHAPPGTCYACRWHAACRPGSH